MIKVIMKFKKKSLQLILFFLLSVGIKEEKGKPTSDVEDEVVALDGITHYELIDEKMKSEELYVQKYEGDFEDYEIANNFVHTTADKSGVYDSDDIFVSALEEYESGEESIVQDDITSFSNEITTEAMVHEEENLHDSEGFHTASELR